MFERKKDKPTDPKQQTQSQEKAAETVKEAPAQQVGVAATTTAGTAVAPAAKAQHPAAGLDFGHLAGQSNVGMEDADRESFAIPFLVVLQKMSPQLDRNDPEYIETAKEGNILNTATREVYDGDEGILVTNVAFKRSFTKWGLREKGGGYKGEYAPSDPITQTTKEDEKRRNILPGGAEQLVDTRLHGVLLMGDSGLQASLIAMTSTNIKASKRWMTDMKEKQKTDQLPTFAHIYKLTTIPDSNELGSWYKWSVAYVGPVTEQEHIDAAVAFHTALTSGQRKMAAGDAMGENS
jgi:hypothetical protein